MGDMGDMGDIGDMADMADMGNMGDMGDMGYIGDMGDMGDIGDMGDMGHMGVREHSLRFGNMLTLSTFFRPAGKTSAKPTKPKMPKDFRTTLQGID